MLLIDCGLFQGYKQLRRRNWAALPFDSRTIDAVVLTHAHIDHSGFLPALTRSGFKGKIYCSAGTSELRKILLPDSAHLQEEVEILNNLPDEGTNTWEHFHAVKSAAEVATWMKLTPAPIENIDRSMIERLVRAMKLEKIGLKGLKEEDFEEPALDDSNPASTPTVPPS